jgi:hypothetical protein
MGLKPGLQLRMVDSVKPKVLAGADLVRGSAGEDVPRVPWALRTPNAVYALAVTTPRLSALRLPLPWDEFDLPNPLQTRSTVLLTGEPAWGWEGDAPELGIPPCEPSPATAAEGWDLDHVVLLVPDLTHAEAAFAAIGLQPRLRMDVRDRPAAFFRAGPLLEVIESPVRAPALYGLALVTEESLEVVVLRWRAMGRDVSDPTPAIQPNRRIFTVRATEAGLAVMSPDGAST